MEQPLFPTFSIRKSEGEISTIWDVAYLALGDKQLISVSRKEIEVICRVFRCLRVCVIWSIRCDFKENTAHILPKKQSQMQETFLLKTKTLTMLFIQFSANKRNHKECGKCVM